VKTGPRGLTAFLICLAGQPAGRVPEPANRPEGNARVCSNEISICNIEPIESWNVGKKLQDDTSIVHNLHDFTIGMAVALEDRVDRPGWAGR
jgi:hypothetical protein